MLLLLVSLFFTLPILIYDIPILLEGENEEDDEDHGVRNNAPVQQAINEDSTSLHRDDVLAV